jgi:hypothetical protein
VRHFTVPWVPTGMKAGVFTFPCAVEMTPERALPSLEVTTKPSAANSLSS